MFRLAACGRFTAALSTIALCVACISQAIAAKGPPAPTASGRYELDPSWPQRPLPHNWTLGEVGGMMIDSHDNVWIVQRPGTLSPWEKASAAQPPIASCCSPAPPVIEFDPSGKIIRAWGGPGEGYDWPSSEHGVYVDYKGNVWIAGNRTRGSAEHPADGMVLKFTADGEFLMQIGHAGPSKGSVDSTQLAGAAGVAVDPQSNEVFIADGYRNHRVIVFDADTGKFKRMWGAYGKPPTDLKVSKYDPATPSKQFRTVHCINLSKDGLVYVCDRDNNRVQVFQRDGTFVTEWFYRQNTLAGGYGPGTVAHLAFWPDEAQSTLAIADLANNQVIFARRSDGREVGHFGHYGNYGGQLNRLHQVAVDSKGNVYTAEATGKRVQKFVRSGMH